MISPSFGVNRRTLPAVLLVAFPQLAFLRALLVRTCDFGAFGSHGPYCYLTLPWTAVASQILGVALVSIPLGVLFDRTVVRRLPWKVRGRSPAWLTSPSNRTLGVLVTLCFGLVLLSVSDPRLSVYSSPDTGTVAGVFETILGWSLYLPSTGIVFGGNYFVSVLRGMVGVTALPVRLLIFGLMVVCSFLQIVWLYAVAAALVGGFRRAQLAVESKKRTT